MPNRRKFLKKSSVASIGMAGLDVLNPFVNDIFSPLTLMNSNENTENLIGLYGPWAVSLIDSKLPSLSFRRKEWTNLTQWREMTKQRLIERLGIPDIGGIPKVTLKKQYEYDGLHIEELTWQLPYGRPTEGILLKPAKAKTPLPAILAFHDHGGNKYFGTRKITKTSDQQHPLMKEHQQEYYEGMAWANEIAKRGYVVLVSDAFPFASRRVWMQDVPAHLRRGLNDNNPENSENIRKYNEWAGEHEHVMSKSLLSAGTTWAGVFYAEDKKALDILCARNDVDAKRVGCAGLSGGGMRTVFMGGLDERIKCAVCVGFMTTWKDLILHKSFTHTWMTYVPILPNELDFPEILGLRSPLPTMVLNDSDDDLYTLSEMKRADTILKEVYTKAGSAERYKCSFYLGPHKFDKKMQAEAFAWFDKWLK
jgi:dienelactone hydrolase